MGLLFRVKMIKLQKLHEQYYPTNRKVDIPMWYKSISPIGEWKFKAQSFGRGGRYAEFEGKEHYILANLDDWSDKTSEKRHYSYYITVDKKEGPNNFLRITKIEKQLGDVPIEKAIESLKGDLMMIMRKYN
jgi:hypothetical protein